MRQNRETVTTKGIDQRELLLTCHVLNSCFRVAHMTRLGMSTTGITRKTLVVDWRGYRERSKVGSLQEKKSKEKCNPKNKRNSNK